MSNTYNIFGVRHLSPAASFHILHYLDEINPKCILIEGPADAQDFIHQLVAKGTKPPIALLAYTTELPISTILYPFASYSPEYQAINWAVKKKREVRFIDLPTDVLLTLRKTMLAQEETAEEGKDFYLFQNDLYSKLTTLSGETEYESYWERNFEHNLNDKSYREGLRAQTNQIRDLLVEKESEEAAYEHSYNLVREAHMRKEIQRAIDEGYKPSEIVIIVGAYHTAGIENDLPPMSDEDLKKLPRAKRQITLMPYTYLRLSSQSGYGAGNRAPYYFEMMWKAMQNKRLEDLPAIYLSRVSRELREAGHNASSASTIEAVRLAQALSSLREGSQAVLKDLHDAATTCLGGGELSVVAEALSRTDIGTAIGYLPEGVSQTPVQEDMNQELKRLKLMNYKTPVVQELSLDLRENLRVKTKEAAFIDLNRSVFFHRLNILNINFAGQQAVNQDKGSWSEHWLLCWTPEVEIEIVEANLKGETLEIATAFVLKEQLTDATSVYTVANTIRKACECNLIQIFDNAIHTLQALLVESADFKEIANAAQELFLLLQYGSIRRFDLEPLIPIQQQLFLRASLLLLDAAACNEQAAGAVAVTMNLMENIAQNMYEIVDVNSWQKELIALSKRDDLNAKLSGVAFSILLERNLVEDDECSKEVSRRLSPGVPADIAAAWFEGLSGRNRYALLSRIALWRELNNYIEALSDDEFTRALVFLRRAFSAFEPNQKNSVAELLADFWGVEAELVAEILQDELSEKEKESLEELNDFDFDF